MNHPAAAQSTKVQSAGDALHAAVRSYIRRGWAPVPIPRGKKAPRVRDWPNLRLAEAELPNYFRDGCGVGILLGEPSGGLVDVDLDAPQAVASAPVFLPPTDRRHGRKSHPGSHAWYIADPVPKPEKFSDLDGTCLVEVRSTGQQTIVPPSVHLSGESMIWEREEEPARINGVELRSAVVRIAACVLVARHWPERGSRHNAAMALAGTLLRAGWTVEEGVKFVTAAARAAGDEEWRTREHDVRSTTQRLAEGGAATGVPRLAEFLGDRVVGRLCDWLGLRSATNAHTANPGPYRIERGCICFEKMTNHGPVVTPLCNFVARVVEELVLDDGVETNRAFMVEGQLESGEKLPVVRVPAARFGGMSWVTESWGLGAVVNAGFATRDRLREAMQRLSSNPRRRQVFMHTGWRETDGTWVYLTASGAVGQDGFEVDLGPELARYRLPRVPEDPVQAMRASLRLLDLAPLSVTAPLWAGVHRAPLAAAYPIDLSLWIEGVTGSLKSTLVALFLCHYGQFDRTSLPGAWSSTANQLEHRAFVLKDAVFTVDDYAPTGLNARETETKAARLLRSQGNLSGRGRLRADLTERPSYPPRGLIIATGEQHPPGQSILARMLLVELERPTVNLAALSEAQRTTARLPHAMAGYLLWLAPQMPSLRALLCETFEGARRLVTADGEHLRVPEVLAHLWLGLHCGLNYAEEVGACSQTEAESYRARCWDALVGLGRAQGRLVETERPSRRFLGVLLAIMTQGRAVLLPKDISEGDPRSDALIGWQDEESLYLMPDAVFQAVARFCRESGELFPIRQERLLRDLAREGLSEHDPGRHTTTVRIGGRSRRVLRLHRAAVEVLLGEEIPSGVTKITGITGYKE